MSTKDKGQDPENQLHQLRAFTERHGTLCRVFTEEVSGASCSAVQSNSSYSKSTSRSSISSCSGGWTALAAKEHWPRYATSKELKDHGVNYKSFTEPYLDSLGPFGDVIVSMLAKKKAAGVKLGTPGKSQAQIEQLRRLKSGGMSN